ncbi:MAG: pyridoxamine 5'-phosphate oxidase [Woeseiaceae bacterium]|nr:pyridoxamine 5'-phosphate oxidase [Woeseiaceae bacterium]
MKDVSDVRKSVTGRSLERDDLDDNAFEQFERWFSEACEIVELEPNACSLSTVDETGAPSSRTILLKYFDETGFVFFTNFASRKSADIAVNDRVSMLFFWRELGRQIKIDGTAAKIPTTESLKYFMTRPRGSQLGAWVSHQSSIITSRSLLEAKFDEIRRKFADKEVPLPSFWGGYRVVPTEIEFWQGRADRLHDRFLYTRADGGWSIERLAP